MRPDEASDKTRRTIPPARKATYYGGMLSIVIGILLFVSNMFFGPELHRADEPQLTDPDWWEKSQQQHREFQDQGQAMMVRALVGMGLMVVGGMLVNVGKKGLSGSGLVLDPQQARTDLEPWSRMGGGVVKDALSEAGVDLGRAEPTVMLRCRACKATSPESAKFCCQCGAEL